MNVITMQIKDQRLREAVSAKANICGANVKRSGHSQNLYLESLIGRAEYEITKANICGANVKRSGHSQNLYLESLISRAEYEITKASICVANVKRNVLKKGMPDAR